MIRCDLHAFYYGALMFPHDPVALRDEPVARGHAASFYFYLHYNDPRKMTVPFIGGFELKRAWDPNRALAQALVNQFGGKQAIVCDSIEDVSKDVDMVFIADCNGDGSDHLKLATPSLDKGIPTFIDKPLAFAFKDAQAIVELARCRRTRVLSLSMLPSAPQAAQFRQRFIELDRPDFICIKGGGTAMAGQIHAISLAQHLCGFGVESVECMGQNQLGFMHLNYGAAKNKPPSGVLLACDSGDTLHCSFYLMATSHKGAIYSPPIGDFDFPYGAGIILKKIRQMAKTGKAPAPAEEMLENIAVAEAARCAQKRGVTVKLSEIWKR